MKLVVQRVRRASVTVGGQVAGAIDKGFLVLLGVSNEDTEEICDKMAEKMLKMRIFEDENGKTNLSLYQVGGEVLVVSQFTLYADCRQNRPSFTRAGQAELANRLYERFVERCREKLGGCEHGVFGAHMDVELLNDGPFTIVMDSRELFS